MNESKPSSSFIIYPAFQRRPVNSDASGKGGLAVRVSVFVGTSLDGFIARANGDFDFLFPSGNEPHGYDEFMATVDALVMGRHTYEKVLTFSEWPYGEKPVFVLSTRPLLHHPCGSCGGAYGGNSRGNPVTDSRRVAWGMFTLMEESPFRTFSRPDSFSGL